MDGMPGQNIEHLRKQLEVTTKEGVEFRLYVVEDLSRDVIEVLGSKCTSNSIIALVDLSKKLPIADRLIINRQH